MVGDYELEDYVTFETNVNLNRLFSIMARAKVYFHPMVGEHFGMSVVEAMAAGLIPKTIPAKHRRANRVRSFEISF